jgi:HSP20 family molecular chaperone IbpA
MKTSHTYIDLGAVFDELFDAASQFRSEFAKSINCIGETIDYYPGFSYPPMNVFLTEDKSLNFEFALAGFDEKNIELSFSGDYMIFSARMGDSNTETVYSAERAEASEGSPPEGSDVPRVHYLKRRLKLKDIEKQKYYVPLDKYAHEEVRAVFKNGILKVTIPPRPEITQNESISITIIAEG